MKGSRLPDKMLSGMVVGFVLPVLVFLIVYLVSYGDRSFAEYIGRIENRNVVTHFISLCVFPNVFAFLLFNRLDKEQSARGVLGITIIWALAVFLIKMV